MNLDQVMIGMNDVTKNETPRDYLGLSMIGNPCHRYLQHYHYWTFSTEISVRLQRLFDFGHGAEDFMIADLAKQGIIVEGRQDEIVATHGHWKGHIDGAIDDVKWLVEFKTHNDKSFIDLKKKGVRLGKFGHYAQCTAYMGNLGFRKCLYVAYNKNNSEYYLEFIDFDEADFAEFENKQTEIIVSDTLLPRIGTGKSTWFECKLCDARHVCFGLEEVEVTCRSCQSVDVLPDGEWMCGATGKILDREDQLEACPHYELGDMFK